MNGVCSCIGLNCRNSQRMIQRNIRNLNLELTLHVCGRKIQMSFNFHLLPTNSPQASVRCPIVNTTASWSCGSRFGLDNRHSSPGMTIDFDKEGTNCSVTERQKKWRIQYNTVQLSCVCLTVVRDASRQCFSDYYGHLTSRSTVCRLRQNSCKSF